MEMMVLSQWRAAGGRATSSAHGELCLGRRGEGKRKFGPLATALGCVSPRVWSLLALGLRLAWS